MTISNPSDDLPPTPAAPDLEPTELRPSPWSRVRRALGLRNASALWVFVVIMVVFSLLIPQTFLASRTWMSLLDTQVVVVITALALIIPLSSGVFDLAIGARVGVASIIAGWLLVPMKVPIPAAIVITLVAMAVIGLVTGLIIVLFHIDSFIATMGVSSLLSGLVTILSGGSQILDIPTPLVDFATTQVFGLTIPFLLMLVIAIVLWYLLERTPLGRRIYAVGGNREAARLSGIRANRVIIGTLTASGVLVGVAGVLVTARLGNADPTIGPDYLLPAFTAAFLGSTQFRGGRFNVWGTVVAVYVLAIGIKGLQLMGTPSWISDIFNGVALLVAVGLAASLYIRRRRTARSRRRPARAPEPAR